MFRLGSRFGELPRVVAVFRAHTAHKTSEFLDLIDRPTLSGLMPIGPWEARSFMARKQKKSKP